MGDPATVIDQYRRYVQDGRLEISEVMASELSDLLLAKKGKTLTEQGHLVTALRDLSNIQEMRSKWKESRAAASMLVKARKRYAKLLRSNGMHDEARNVSKSEAADSFSEVQPNRPNTNNIKMTIDKFMCSTNFLNDILQQPHEHLVLLYYFNLF